MSNVKNISLILEKDSFLKVDVGAVSDWDGFDKLIQFLKNEYKIEVLKEIDGPDARRWLLRSEGCDFELQHDDPYGNLIVATSKESEELVRKIGLDLEQRLSGFGPVEDYFNRLAYREFMSALENFSKGLGYNPEDMTCFFPSDIVEEEGGVEQDYDYIEFWTYSSNQEVRLGFAEFIEVLTRAAEREMNLNPDAKEKIQHLVMKTKN